MKYLVVTSMLILSAALSSFTYADHDHDKRDRRGGPTPTPIRSGGIIVGTSTARGGISVSVGPGGVQVGSYGYGQGRGRGGDYGHRDGRGRGRGYGHDNRDRRDHHDRRRDRYYPREESIVLPFYGQVFGGRNQVSMIHLKQELMRKTRMDLRDYELKSVKLVAKSKAGFGQAKLIVDGVSSYPESVRQGYYGDFFSDNYSSYNQIYMYDATYSSYNNGAWMIQLTGMIKVKEVVVNLAKKYHY